jgi:hypothetical protein
MMRMMGWVGVLLMSVGIGRADVVFFEDFESSSIQFTGATQSANTHLYTSNYTGPKPTGGGSRYFYGGTTSTGLSGSWSTTNFSIQTASLTASKIDAGLGQFNFSSWFSSFSTVNPATEYAYVELQFKNGSGTNVGSVFTIGGQSFTSGISVSSGKRNWGQDIEIGAIPTLARQAALTIYSVTNASGDRDGYADLVSLDVTAVPEPGTLLLGGIAAACGGGGVWWKRRKRKAVEGEQAAGETVV